MRSRLRAVALPPLVGAGLAATAIATTPAPVARIGGCRTFAAGSTFTHDVSKVPVDPRSAAYVASIGLGKTLHPDFGSGRYGNYGIPITVATARTPRVPVRFTAYGDESDPGPYPIPTGARVEGGSDRHVLVVQRSRCKLYELFDAHRAGRGWAASSGAVFDLRTHPRRPAGWTSADAAGLPIAPLLARADEARAGAIHHALRMTVSRTQAAYVAPARHLASSDADPALPPMGLRLRLKAGFDVSRFHGQARVILVALRRYGAIVADNGSDWYLSGTPDRRWSDDDLDQLKRVPGSAFEALRTGPLHR